MIQSKDDIIRMLLDIVEEQQDAIADLYSYYKNAVTDYNNDIVNNDGDYGTIKEIEESLTEIRNEFFDGIVSMNSHTTDHVLTIDYVLAVLKRYVPLPEYANVKEYIDSLENIAHTTHDHLVTQEDRLNDIIEYASIYEQKELGELDAFDYDQLITEIKQTWRQLRDKDDMPELFD